MDYFTIGQNVRRFRKIKGMSQEQLAEAVGISVTHMSHIETGNTKLSLPVLACLASVLNVDTDMLIFGRPAGEASSCSEIARMLEDCTPSERRTILEIVKAAKAALRKYH